MRQVTVQVQYGLSERKGAAAVVSKCRALYGNANWQVIDYNTVTGIGSATK